MRFLIRFNCCLLIIAKSVFLGKKICGGLGDIHVLNVFCYYYLSYSFFLTILIVINITIKTNSMPK